MFYIKLDVLQRMCNMDPNSKDGINPKTYSCFTVLDMESESCFYGAVEQERIK